MTLALIIEDNDDNMELISILLQNEGYELCKAIDGPAGVQMAIQNNPDLIICDIQLPGFDGVEALRRIRESPECQGAVVVAMTSYAMAGDRERLLGAGFDGYIEKPINPLRVIQQIKTFIEKSHENRHR